jgi:Intraflagellar transport 81 calponin homology domain
VEDFQSYMMAGDKDVLHTVIHWCLQRFEHLQKRAYLARYLMPVEVPAEFLGEPLIIDLSQRLKELQADFKEVHKAADQVNSTGVKPSELKNEVAQLESEKTQLQNKIARMKKDFKGDEAYLKEMLTVGTCLLGLHACGGSLGPHSRAHFLLHFPPASTEIQFVWPVVYVCACFFLAENIFIFVMAML